MRINISKKYIYLISNYNWTLYYDQSTIVITSGLFVTETCAGPTYSSSMMIRTIRRRSNSSIFKPPELALSSRIFLLSFSPPLQPQWGRSMWSRYWRWVRSWLQTDSCIFSQLYHSTFVLSCQALNHKGNLFTLEDLKAEFKKKLLFGFLEGIWYLDIIYQGRRPEPYSQELDCEDHGRFKIELTDDIEESEQLAMSFSFKSILFLLLLFSLDHAAADSKKGPEILRSCWCSSHFAKYCPITHVILSVGVFPCTWFL